ncbi:MAG: flagellar hook-associated protein FlgL [Firmicutes bacterium]|nr:flagellar hook-associated protein FlgL [Bacillota bacterium]
MRVTTGMMIDGVLADLRSTWSRLSRYERELSSGKRLLRPSDDPVGVVRSLSLRSELNRINRYLANADDASNWLEITDAALGQAGDVIQRVRELAVSTLGTVPRSTLQAVHAEVSRLLEQLVAIGNTQYADRYIFAGQQTLTPPFTLTGNPTSPVSYNGDARPIWREVGSGITVQVNRPGDGALQRAMVTTATFVHALDTAISTGGTVPPGVLDDLDGALDAILQERAQVGADAHRIEATRSRLQDSVYEVTSLLSETEDADMAEVIVRLTSTEAAYRAALEAGARIIQPSLLDFLR